MKSNGASRKNYRFGRFLLDTGQHVLKREGEFLPLPPKVIDTLAVLVEHAGEVVDRETLFRSVWPDTHVVESSLTRNISVLRKALGGEDGRDGMIQTVAKRGYRFAAPVECEEPEPASRRAARRWPWMAAPVAVLLLAALGLGRLSSPPSGRLTEADRQYLVGRYMWNKVDRDGIQKALERFQKAAELDPNLALAYAGIADSYTIMTHLAIGNPSANLSQARTAAMRAVSLDDSLARPHVSLGHVRWMADFDWRGAEREFLRAIQLEPNSAPANSGYADFLAQAGRMDEARSFIRRARELDPVSPMVGLTAGRIEYFDRHYQRAADVLREVLELEPSFWPAQYYMAMSLGFLNRPEEAGRHLVLARVHASLRATEQAWLHSLSGDRGPARALLAERLELVRKGAGNAAILVMPAIDAGNLELAVNSLEEMWKMRAVELLEIKVNPRFDPLRPLPRFAALVRKVVPE